jgi:ribonuclease HII
MAKRESLRARPDFAAERALHRQGYVRIAGVDEAGRGPLAGPVVAAAVVLDPLAIPDGIADSKLLGANVRERLFEAICASADVAVACASAETVDRINIRAATLLAMRRALSALSRPPDAVLVDGCDLPDGIACRCEGVIGGDGRCLSIAAASIVAKVARDRMMARADALFSGYGLKGHKGYGTAEHRSALARLGPSPIHRQSFSPVAACRRDATHAPGACDPEEQEGLGPAPIRRGRDGS